MRDFNVPALWNISIHEVYPGHFLHGQHLRQVDSKVRKSRFFAPASFTEGWAHYCEQMMMEAGFQRDDQTVRLGQLSESLVRLARFVVSIRLHCEDLSVEQGMRFFRDEAFLEEATARREAERGTFDPTYLVYAAGKMMMLKLRRDYKEQQGNRYSATRVPRRGAEPGLGAVLGASPAAAERDDRRVARIVRLRGSRRYAALRIRVRRVRPALRDHPEVFGWSAGHLPAVRERPGAAAALVSRDSVQGHAAGTSPTTRRRGNREARAARAPKSDAKESKDGSTRVDGQRHEQAGSSRDSHLRRSLSSSSRVVRPPSTPAAPSQARRIGQTLTFSVERLEVTPERPGEVGPAQARSRPAPSGIRACCRCRGARP